MLEETPHGRCVSLTDGPAISRHEPVVNTSGVLETTGRRRNFQRLNRKSARDDAIGTVHHRVRSKTTMLDYDLSETLCGVHMSWYATNFSAERARK